MDPRQITVPKKFCKTVTKEKLNPQDIIKILDQNKETIQLLTNPKSSEKCKRLVKLVNPLSSRLRGVLKKTCSLIRKEKTIKTCLLQ